MAITFDPSLLTAYYQARTRLALGTASLAMGAGGQAAAKPAPTPPWAAASEAPKMTELVRSVLAGGKFINPSSAKLDVTGSSEDYRKLFGVYQGLVALQGLAEQISAKGVGDTEKARLRARFNEGMKELGAYLDAATFEKFQLAQGAVSAKAKSTVGIERANAVYNTGILHKGAASAEVEAFKGTVKFSMSATIVAVEGQPGTTRTVDFDLDEMGATPRTMSNVVIYLNNKLKAAGVAARFANVRTPGAPETVKVGNQTVTLGTAPDSYSLKIEGVATEQISFSAPDDGPAVYLGGAISTASKQLVKYGTDPATAATPDGKIYANGLPEAAAIRQMKTGPDGSIYVLADVTGTVSGQTIKGQSDVALMKYDSAGNLAYTRTLGAASAASGYALAVSDDGSRVAVAGSVTGTLDYGEMVPDAKTADSFVAVFDEEGQTVFSHRRGAMEADQVDSITFGDDGSIYVAGTAGSAMPGAAGFGGQDAYIRGFKPTAAGALEPYAESFTTQYGTAGVDKAASVAVDGSTMIVAGVENGEAIIRRYQLQASGAPVLQATRSLGAIQGGIAGVSIGPDGSVVVAGTTSNANLSAGTVTKAFTGTQAAFVAKLDGSLAASAADRLTYFGGGTRSASALTLVDGKAYITGQVGTTPMPGQTSAFDGYAAAVDPDTGAVDWSRQFQGAERQSAPTAIAVDSGGASVLDRLGLPKGTIDYSDSPLLTAASSVRPGDQFYVRVGTSTAKAVTIEANDTLKTLADKINRALGFTAKVEVVNDKGYDRLQITPLNNRNPVELAAGKTGRDALWALGLTEGLVALSPDAKKKEKPVYALELPSTINLDNEGKVKQAQAQLLTALSTLRKIYQEATAPPSSKTPVTGQVPAYLTAQIANYQQALARLMG